MTISGHYPIDQPFDLAFYSPYAVGLEGRGVILCMYVTTNLAGLIIHTETREILLCTYSTVEL